MLLLLGLIHLGIGLVLAWLLVGLLYLEWGFLQRIFRSGRELIRAHIDFLLMSLFLLVFHLLYQQAGLQPSAATKILLAIGPFGNASGFILLSVKPDLDKSPFSFTGILFALVFTCTTAGFVLAGYELYTLCQTH